MGGHPPFTSAPPQWLDREALAAYISVRVDQVQRLQRSGKLPEPSLHWGRGRRGGTGMQLMRWSARPIAKPGTRR